MKKTLALVLSAAAMTAALTGCGGGNTAETEPQTIGAPTTEAPAETEAETENAEPTGAQELTFVLNNEPDSLDPSYTNNSCASPFLTNRFEGLVT